jgi:hypothetical protein
LEAPITHKSCSLGTVLSRQSFYSNDEKHKSNARFNQSIDVSIIDQNDDNVNLYQNEASFKEIN